MSSSFKFDDASNFIISSIQLPTENRSDWVTGIRELLVIYNSFLVLNHIND